MRPPAGEPKNCHETIEADAACRDLRWNDAVAIELKTQRRRERPATKLPQIILVRSPVAGSALSAPLRPGAFFRHRPPSLNRSA